jgi:hypothetical protein
MLFTAVLRESVHDGAIHNQTLCQDKKFVKYVEQLSATNPDSLSSREARLAFWINSGSNQPR